METKEEKNVDDFEEKINHSIDKVANACEKMQNFSEQINSKMLAMNLQRCGYSSQGIAQMQEVIKTQDPKLVLRYIGLCLSIFPKNKDKSHDTKEQGGEIDE